MLDRLNLAFFCCLLCIWLFTAGFALLVLCLLSFRRERCGLWVQDADTGAFLVLGPAHRCPFCFQGRQEGVQIDQWEDADFTLYKVTDRFGFLQ